MTVDDFLELCTPNLKKGDALVLAEKVTFSSEEWMRIYQVCRGVMPGRWRVNGSVLQSPKRCYNMQVLALNKAVEVASKPSDWAFIALYAQSGKQRRLAQLKTAELARA